MNNICSLNNDLISTLQKLGIHLFFLLDLAGLVLFVVDFGKPAL